MASIRKITLERQVPKIIGMHVYGNMSGIDEKLLTDMDFLLLKVKESAKAGNLHIIEILTKKFKLHGAEAGVSIIALLEESHISLHTWPEGNYATLDVYSCGAASNPDAAFKYIVAALKPTSVKISRASRSNC
ncbi:MAG: adenosylmethionine decarboxylase [Candidatus Marsarchaeota archaeon]|jgi:S-adenosylmethionine decarboxylase|nr:adenosylmethionine decarboxylase [Candidatus Marsarchaeota archaeon]